MDNDATPTPTPLLLRLVGLTPVLFDPSTVEVFALPRDTDEDWAEVLKRAHDEFGIHVDRAAIGEQMPATLDRDSWTLPYLPGRHAIATVEDVVVDYHGEVIGQVLEWFEPESETYATALWLPARYLQDGDITDEEAHSTLARFARHEARRNVAVNAHEEAVSAYTRRLDWLASNDVQAIELRARIDNAAKLAQTETRILDFLRDRFEFALGRWARKHWLAEVWGVDPGEPVRKVSRGAK